MGAGGVHPSCNILIQFDELNEPYLLETRSYLILDAIIGNLEQMAARYRIGDGRGATYVDAANNCAQDSSQAFYTAIAEVSELIETDHNLDQWMDANIEQATRLRHIQDIGHDLMRKLVGDGTVRPDWRFGIENLGFSKNAVRNLLRGLETWRTLLPRRTSDTYAEVFLNEGAALWVLSTFQIGGDDPNIEPIPPWAF